jgi:FkbM family methyltransferase
VRHGIPKSAVEEAAGLSTAQPLPAPLRIWSRIGRRVPIKARLRVTRALSSRLVSSGVPYEAGGGFVFEIDSDDPFQATMLAGLYDPFIEALLGRFVGPGDTVIDGGAHLGYFSLRLGSLVGPHGSVHSFECDPRVVPRLRRHVEMNGLDWISVNACGLLDESTDDATLFLPSQLGWSSVLEGAWGATHAATVSMVTIDDYVAENGLDPAQLSFLKLDVEGGELQALRGARETLAGTSAPVLVEFIPARMRAMGQDPSDLVTLMAEHGFAPWTPRADRRGHVRLLSGALPEVGEDLVFLKGRPA